MDPKDRDFNTEMDVRSAKIVRAGVTGIVANVFLASFKAVVGLASHSIAITVDAVNNLTDVMSALVTIIGAKLSRKDPDKEHPFGHGRSEYLSAMVIASLILYAGVSAAIESVRKIMHPVVPQYSKATFIVLVAAIGIKIFLSLYTKKTGREINSDALVATGFDAMIDAAIAAATLISALVFIATGKSFEPYLAAVISVIIFKAGLDMMLGVFSSILGERVEGRIARDIENTIMGFPEINGAYDLVLHNYGPDTFMGSVCVELPDTCTLDRADEICKNVQREVYKKNGVILTAVGIYAMNTGDDEAAEIRTVVNETVMANEHVLQMHGFYVDVAAKRMAFDIVVDFSCPDKAACYEEIKDEVAKIYPMYEITVRMDSDISDL